MSERSEESFCTGTPKRRVEIRRGKFKGREASKQSYSSEEGDDSRGMEDSDEESESVSEEIFDGAGELKLDTRIKIVANCQYLVFDLSLMNLSDKNVRLKQ